MGNNWQLTIKGKVLLKSWKQVKCIIIGNFASILIKYSKRFSASAMACTKTLGLDPSMKCLSTSSPTTYHPPSALTLTKVAKHMSRVVSLGYVNFFSQFIGSLGSGWATKIILTWSKANWYTTSKVNTTSKRKMNSIFHRNLTYQTKQYVKN